MIFYYEYVQIYKPIYEVYFEKPVIVNDSFYVAGTANNSYYAFSHIRTNEDSFGDVYQDSVFAKAHPETRYAFTKKEEGQPYGFPVPRSVKYRAHLIDAHNPYVVGADLHDYDWHVFDANDFVNIFAIIDTNWTGPDTTGTSEGDDSCYAPFNLRVTEKGYTNATLLWDCAGGSEWQLAVGKNSEVSGPDQASFYDVGHKYCIVSGLDTATEYVAWVRSVCDSVTASDWSDSIVFATLSLVPPVDDTTHVDPPNPPDSLSVNTLAASPNVSIYPNPAMDEFVIESQCRIARIEMFSSKGELLRRQESTSHTLRVDVTGWAKGVYVVRVYTTGGDVIKKLIIK